MKSFSEWWKEEGQFLQARHSGDGGGVVEIAKAAYRHGALTPSSDTCPPCCREPAEDGHGAVWPRDLCSACHCVAAPADSIVDEQLDELLHTLAHCSTDTARRIAIRNALAPAPTTQAAPVAQREALTYEQEHAIRQGHEIASSDAYFQARPQIDGLDRRNVFRAGFERGWDAARAQAKEGGAA